MKAPDPALIQSRLLERFGATIDLDLIQFVTKCVQSKPRLPAEAYFDLCNALQGARNLDNEPARAFALDAITDCELNPELEAEAFEITNLNPNQNDTHNTKN